MTETIKVSEGTQESNSTTVQYNGSPIVCHLPDNDEKCETSTLMLENCKCESASSVCPTEMLVQLENYKCKSPPPMFSSATLVVVDDMKCEDTKSVYPNGTSIRLDGYNCASASTVDPYEKIGEFDKYKYEFPSPMYPSANVAELDDSKCSTASPVCPSMSLPPMLSTVTLDDHNCKSPASEYTPPTPVDIDYSKPASVPPVYSTETLLQVDNYPCETLQMDENQGVNEPHAYSGENPVQLEDYNCKSISSVHSNEIIMKLDQKKCVRASPPDRGEDVLKIEAYMGESETPVFPRNPVEHHGDYNSEDELTAINFPKPDFSLGRRTRKLPNRPQAPTSKRFWGSRIRESLPSIEQGARILIKPIPNQLPKEAYFIPISSPILSEFTQPTHVLPSVKVAGKQKNPTENPVFE